MKSILGLAAVAMMAGVSAWASAAGEAPANRVTVCISTGNVDLMVSQAESMASRIFASSGVAIEWRRSGCPASPDAIKISFSHQTPEAQLRGALAYALPFEGTHIVVFYDRVEACAKSVFLPRLLAYVMVHEITHILQAVPVHSETGIMKARWDPADYAAIRLNGLAFTPKDITLIHLGLNARASRLAGMEPALAASR